MESSPWTDRCEKPAKSISNCTVKNATNATEPEDDFRAICRNNHLVLLQAEDADTLVIIGRPPQPSNQSNLAYEPTDRHFSKAHQIHSKNVFSLGSSKLSELFGPTAQFRTERRLKKQGVLISGKPHNVRYLLDLRPPDQDEEAILLITELTCSTNILSWSEKQQLYKIPPAMICGQDDYVPLSTRIMKPQPKVEVTQSDLKKKSVASSPKSPARKKSAVRSKDAKSPRIGNWKGILPTAPAAVDKSDDMPADDDGENGDTIESEEKRGQSESPPQVDPPPVLQSEYSQLRHWSGLERLLHAIEGLDPMLDSAPKVWTFFALANYFGCFFGYESDDRIGKWVMNWLFQGPNDHFIQHNPEACYRMGLGMRSEALTKMAFSLLVGEKAATNAQGGKTTRLSLTSGFSAAGRKLEILDDDEVNRIDHAATMFTKRCLSCYEYLIGSDMEWLSASPAIQSLLGHRVASPEELQAAQKVMGIIKKYIRNRIVSVLSSDYAYLHRPDARDPSPVEMAHWGCPDYVSQYNQKGEKGRILSRIFWMALASQSFAEGESSASAPMWEHRSRCLWPIIPVEGPSAMANQQRKAGKLCTMSKQVLKTSETNFEGSLRKRPTFSPSEAAETPGNTSMEGSPARTLDEERGSGSQMRLAIRSKDGRHGTGAAAEAEKPVLKGHDDHLAEQVAVKSSQEALQHGQGTGYLSRPQESGVTKELPWRGSEWHMIDRILDEATRLVRKICDDMVLPSHLFADNHVIPTNDVEHIASLNESEWQYLPLWAGGLDDGTGGVFVDGDVPDDESGRFGGGIRGLDALSPTSLNDGSDWSQVNSTIGGASKRAVDGTATATATVKSFSEVDTDMMSVVDRAEGQAEINHGVTGPSLNSISSIDKVEIEVEVDALDEVAGTTDGMMMEEIELTCGESSDWDDCET